MYTILLNSNDEGHSFKSFNEKFIEICNEHKSNDRALAFAFILYDFTNPQISKVLKDRDYWMSLNEISGEYLTVFSFHCQFKPRKTFWSFFEDLNFPKSMSTVHTHINPSRESDALIKKYFGNETNVKYPAVAFFQVHDNKVIDHVLIQLDERFIENAFWELQLYIQTAVDTLKKISSEFKNNSIEIFDLVASDVKSVRNNILLKRGIKKVTSIADLASTVVGLGG